MQQNHRSRIFNLLFKPIKTEQNPEGTARDSYQRSNKSSLLLFGESAGLLTFSRDWPSCDETRELEAEANAMTLADVQRRLWTARALSKAMRC